MQIHQLNIQYQADQDRVLARVNTSVGTELRLWLTRRLTLGLLPVLRKVEGEQLQKSLAVQADADTGLSAQDPKVRELLGEFKKEQNLQQADFKTPYKEPGAGPTSEPPLLVTEVQITPLPNFSARLQFVAHLADSAQKRHIKIELDQKMMHGLVHLIEKAFADSQWGQAPLAGSGADAAADKTVANARPQYLN